MCRFRPPNSREKREGKAKIVCKISDDSTQVQVDNGKVGDTKARDFVFDRIMGISTTQMDVFQVVGIPLIESLMAGYNCTLFAYGQTGSGKTWTMEGDLGDPDLEGLIPRMVGEIFNKIANNDGSQEYNYFLQISYLEIYNEKLKDLLDPTNEPRIRGAGGATGVVIQHVCEQYVSSADEVFGYIQRGAVNRSVGKTGMNADSSRSHAVFTLKLTQENVQDSTKKNSKLLLVDLAGSEKVNKTGAKGQLLEEAKNINKSLSTLGRVISKLSKAQSEGGKKGNKTYIPYRDSVLTRLLSDALGGNSQTCLILAASPALFNCEETLSTLRFGKRAKEIKNNVSINQELSVSEYKKRLNAANKIISQLKAENQQLKYKVESLKNVMNEKEISDPSAQDLIEKIEKEFPVSNLVRTMTADLNLDTKNSGKGKTSKNDKSSKKRPKPSSNESAANPEDSKDGTSNKKSRALTISTKDSKANDADSKEEENRAPSPALSTVSSLMDFANCMSPFVFF